MQCMNKISIQFVHSHLLYAEICCCFVKFLHAGQITWDSASCTIFIPNCRTFLKAVLKSGLAIEPCILSNTVHLLVSSRHSKHLHFYVSIPFLFDCISAKHFHFKSVDFSWYQCNLIPNSWHIGLFLTRSCLTLFLEAMMCGWALS